jgi:hypothetical protein
MAANELAIVNQAILNLGDSRLLTSTDGTAANIVEATTPQGLAAVTFFDQARTETLRGFPWAFATKTDLLSLDSEGDGEVWEDQWDFAYAYPGDCLQLLRFLTTRGPNDPFPPRYVIGVHGGEKVIFTDVLEADARVQYIEDVTDVTRFPPVFDMVLSWRVASFMAMPSSANGKTSDWALQRWQAYLTLGERYDANESNPHPTFRDENAYTRARFV